MATPQHMKGRPLVVRPILRPSTRTVGLKAGVTIRRLSPLRASSPLISITRTPRKVSATVIQPAAARVDRPISERDITVMGMSPRNA